MQRRDDAEIGGRQPLGAKGPLGLEMRGRLLTRFTVMCPPPLLQVQQTVPGSLRGLCVVQVILIIKIPN